MDTSSQDKDQLMQLSQEYQSQVRTAQHFIVVSLSPTDRMTCPTIFCKIMGEVVQEVGSERVTSLCDLLLPMRWD